MSYPNLLLAVTLDTISLGLLIYGSCERAKRETPKVAIILVGIVGFAAAVLLTLTYDSAILRLAALNGVHAALLGVCGWIWFRGSETKAAQRPLAYVFFAFSLMSVAFPFTMNWLAVSPDPSHYQYSISWVVFNFMIIIMVMVAGLGLTSIFTDDMLKMIKIASNTDILTGLKTRRAFEEELIDIFLKLERSPLPLSMIVADIDHFKTVNDTYGHQTGDQVIATFGELMLKCSRKADLVARIGGEEFCIVLWNADAAGARLVAENMRTQFQEAVFKGIPKHKKFTSSFGVASLLPGEDAEDIYRRADQALYKAKQTGRNRVCVDLPDDTKPAEQQEDFAEANIVRYPNG